MALARLQSISRIRRAFQPQRLPSPSGGSRSYFNSHVDGIAHRGIMTCSCKISSILGRNVVDPMLLRSTNLKVWELAIHSNGSRCMSTKKVPVGARQVALKVTMNSPGFVYDPYKPRDPISFWRRHGYAAEDGYLYFR